MKLDNSIEKEILAELKKIDNRQKPKAAKGSTIKSITKIIKGEKSLLDTVFDNSFEEQKLDDKKQFIRNYPLPDSPQMLLGFASFLSATLRKATKEPDKLTSTWKEKFEQVILFAEEKFSGTSELENIKTFYKSCKRIEKRTSWQEGAILFAFLPFVLFALFIAFHLPVLLFASIVLTYWAVFLLLYVFGLLDRFILFIRKQAIKQKFVHKAFRILAWNVISLLIASIVTLAIYATPSLLYIPCTILFLDLLFLLIVYNEQ